LSRVADLSCVYLHPFYWRPASSPSFFLFTTPAPPEIYTLSLHDALPIFIKENRTYDQVLGDMTDSAGKPLGNGDARLTLFGQDVDRKSTRLNSSHRTISYAVFCLKKKKKNKTQRTTSNQRQLTRRST